MCEPDAYVLGIVVEVSRPREIGRIDAGIHPDGTGYLPAD